MTKSHSLLNAAKLAHKWEVAFMRYSSDDARKQLKKMDMSLFNLFENMADKLTSDDPFSYYEYNDVSTFSDSAGTSVTARVGDHHCVSYWDGEDIIFIYECSRDTDLSEALTGNPIYSITL
jgi:hypothetical protein